jgi:LacI family transcriptional regulator
MSQKEIAERLGLSRTTVSRCFTNHPKINPETRARVFNLAAKIGYSYAPPRNATLQRSDTPSTIVVLIGEPKSLGKSHEETARQILSGISEGIAQRKLKLSIHYEDPETFRVGTRARRIIGGESNHDFLGFIIIFPFDEMSIGNLASKFPVVTVLDDYENLNVDCIDVDQTRGIAMMVRHLADLGHEKLGFVSWRYTVPTPWVERRFGAFVENLYRLGLPFDEEHVVNVSRERRLETRAVTSRVLAWIESGVTGIVCAADHQAYSLASDLRKAGVRIPEDVSITGFDGVSPPEGEAQLTTVRMAFREIGSSSVLSLVRRTQHPSSPRRHVLVDGKQVMGSTTGPRGVKS